MIQHVCDRCGSVINPAKSALHVITYECPRTCTEDEKELCCTCGMRLKRFIDGKADIVEEEADQ